MNVRQRKVYSEVYISKQETIHYCACVKQFLVNVHDVSKRRFHKTTWKFHPAIYLCSYFSNHNYQRLKMTENISLIMAVLVQHDPTYRVLSRDEYSGSSTRKILSTQMLKECSLYVRLTPIHTRHKNLDHLELRLVMRVIRVLLCRSQVALIIP